MREYESIAKQQKDLLLKESKSLQQKFSQDLLDSQNLEHTVMNLSSMIMEFTTMIESQSEVVQVVHEVTKDSTQSVQLTDTELLLTLERNQSYHWNMVILIVSLGCLLLVLHFVTP